MIYDVKCSIYNDISSSFLSQVTPMLNLNLHYVCYSDKKFLWAYYVFVLIFGLYLLLLLASSLLFYYFQFSFVDYLLLQKILVLTKDVFGFSIVLFRIKIFISSRMLAMYSFYRCVYSFISILFYCFLVYSLSVIYLFHFVYPLNYELSERDNFHCFFTSIFFFLSCHGGYVFLKRNRFKFTSTYATSFVCPLLSWKLDIEKKAQSRVFTSG